MLTEVQPFLLYCHSSVHAGTGSELGIVDLPIQREQHTGFPKIESSSLKGAIRASVEATLETANSKAKDNIIAVFGSEPDDNSSGESVAGAIAFSDARILFFPVKSFKGVFAWVTCPMVLERFAREMRLYSRQELIPGEYKEETVSGKKLLIQNHVILEEYSFQVTVDETTQNMAEIFQDLLFGTLKSDFAERVLVLSNDDFMDFVKLSTEVNARIRIDSQTGVVQNGALWNEENVPPETVFYSFAFAGQVRNKSKASIVTARDVIDFIKEEKNFPEIFQLGGNYTLGKGIIQRIWL